VRAIDPEIVEQAVAVPVAGDRKPSDRRPIQQGDEQHTVVIPFAVVFVGLVVALHIRLGGNPPPFGDRSTKGRFEIGIDLEAEVSIARGGKKEGIGAFD
jgi:hypothetical protein